VALSSLLKRGPGKDTDGQGGLSVEVARVMAAGQVPTFRQARALLTAEMDRARRYGRPLALAIVCAGAPADAAAPEHDEAMVGAPDAPPSLLAGLVASVLREAMRETDIVTFSITGARCLVVIPEAGRAEMRQAMDRLLAAQPAVPVRIGMAVFPDDGWTLTTLLEHAEAESLGEWPSSNGHPPQQAANDGRRLP
jgi:hypothetical protein